MAGKERWCPKHRGAFHGKEKIVCEALRRHWRERKDGAGGTAAALAGKERPCRRHCGGIRGKGEVVPRAPRRHSRKGEVVPEAPLRHGLEDSAARAGLLALALRRGVTVGTRRAVLPQARRLRSSSCHADNTGVCCAQAVSIARIWRRFRGLPQELGLPFAPAEPIVHREEPDRPQPRRDRDADKAMAVTVGRLRPCKLYDVRFVGLHHNTVRGAAGGALLTAELLKTKGYLS